VLIIRSLKTNEPKLRLLLSCMLVIFCVACSVTRPSDTASLVAELNMVLPEEILRGNSPSIQVTVIHQGQDIWSQAFGENTSIDHIYMNASVQKVFSTTAVLQLVERDLIDLDADISEYVPFVIRHPSFPETPITVRMLLAHRSGLDAFPHQFAWDTECTFSPHFRQPCPANLLAMSHEEFLIESLTPEGSNYDQQAWVYEPGREYHYSVSAYPFLRYLIGQVTGQSYAEYMQENIFAPLGMTSSGFSAEEFVGRHAIPYTRLDGENIELPIWNGQGSMMHTTAEDMAKFLVALMNNGQNGDFQVLQPETIDLMQQRTTRFNTLSFFRSNDDLTLKGYGLGLIVFRGGWFGYGGSAPGFQSLLRFNPSRKIGYVILSNVNAILGGGKNYESARREVYDVQDALISILDPTFVIRRLTTSEIGLIGATVLCSLIVTRFWVRRRKEKRRKC
jgi:CubicO group peptidase (beta-lactamase class C family)